MIAAQRPRQRMRAAAAYVAAVTLCLLVLMWSMRLWEADLRIPFEYSGDAVYNAALIKGIIDNGWYLHNRFVGMPTGLDIPDYLNTYALNYAIIKIISLFALDYAAVGNLFFLLGFPLTTLTSLLVLRHLRLPFSLSIAGALLFTFVPYHFLRGFHHLMLSAYYQVPLMVMVILWVFAAGTTGEARFDTPMKSRGVLSVVICLIVASTGAYYAFFACFFLVIAGLRPWLREKRLRHAAAAAALAAVIILAGLANVLPTILYRHAHGTNLEAATRSANEAEIYGLKISQLLLPVDGHRISALARLKAQYNQVAPLVNENTTASLGLIGGFGFCILVGALFYGDRQTVPLLHELSLLNIAAVLLGTIGGFSALLALAGFPQIRGYSRISVYIAFFSLCAVLLLLEESIRVYARTARQRRICVALVWAVLFVGLLDQIPASVVPAYGNIKGEYSGDAEFVTGIESMLPPSAMVFQLPYAPFPGPAQVYHMIDFELFKAYLHSKTLRWSYGAMRGRDGDLWQRSVVKKPLPDLLADLSAAGFRGIYINRVGYDDGARALVADISTLLNREPWVSDHNRLVFFPLDDTLK